MIRAVLVDDDAVNRDYLGELLRAPRGVEVVGEAANIAEATRVLSAGKPDVLFLDVKMPGGTGFDLLKQLGTWPFEVIFTTGLQRYAIQALRFSTLDYLLKPVEPDALVEALRRFAERHPQLDRNVVQQQFLGNIAQPDEQALKLTLTAGDRTYFIPPADLTHCTADDNYTELHVQNGRHSVSARTLKDYEEMLTPLGCIRVHRSALVNRNMRSHTSIEAMPC